MLNQLKIVTEIENMLPYRDNGLDIFLKMSGPEVKRKKKELVKILKINGLSITVKTNFKTGDFLDIHFNLIKQIYQLH